MRLITILTLALVTFLASSSAFAGGYTTLVGRAGEGSFELQCAAARQVALAEAPPYPFRIVSGTADCHFRSENTDLGTVYEVRIRYYDEGEGPGQTSSPVYNAQYTDEECQQTYGSVSVLVSESYQAQGGSIDVGACLLSPKGGVGFYSKYNAQGEEAPDGMLYYTNDFTATSTGNENSLSAPSPDTSDDLPDYLTPAPDCQVNCVTFDGTTYQVDQSEIDTGNVSLGSGSGGGGSNDGGDSTGGGSDDGGSDGGSSGGDSGSDDGTDGGSSGGGSDGGDSGGSGGGGSGGSGGGSGGADGGSGDTGNDDGLGLGDVIDAINDGFNGLVDTLTDTEGVPSESEMREGFDGQGVTDDVMTQLDDDATAAQGDLNDRFRDYFTNEGSALGQTLGYVRDKVTGLVPEVSTGGCTPLVFGSGERSFTIDCEHFDLIKAALAWLLYFFTAYQVTAIAFSYRNGSEA